MDKELVLLQSHTPAVEKNKLLYFMGIELLLPQSRNGKNKY